MHFYHGLDIVDIRRVKTLYERFGSRFTNKILSENEINYLKRFSNETLLRKISDAFATKEATSKALGTGFSQGIIMRNIELQNDELGKPYIILNGQAKIKADQLKGSNKNKIFVTSISNEKNYVVASVNLIFF